MTKKQEKTKKKLNYLQYANPKPCSSFVPGQAYKLSELMLRYESGQRLGVRETFNIYDEVHGEDETFNMAPPEDVVDVVDVQRLYKQHERVKQELSKRMEEKPEKPKPDEVNNVNSPEA